MWGRRPSDRSGPAPARVRARPTNAAAIGTPDSSAVLVDGPWEHRYVGANGARFHLAVAGSGPLVLFLHGYPQFWWTWRHQLSTVAEHGFRAAAMDLRGYGASDKPPDGYELWNLAADVAGVIRSLGASEAVLVGHGAGGIIAWAMPHLYPPQVTAVAAVGCPHPAVVPRLSPRSLRGLRDVLTSGVLARTATSRVRERRIGTDPAYVESLLRRWAAPGSQWPSKPEAALYTQVMALPFAAHTAGESYRWLAQAPLHPQGRRLRRLVCNSVTVPVLQLHGSADPLCSPEMARRSGQFVSAGFTRHEIAGAGHFMQEEAPHEVGAHLTDWLQTLRGT